MKLTKKQREEVVHLLRCAADCGGLYEALSVITDIGEHGYALDPSGEVGVLHAIAMAARQAVAEEFPWRMPYEMQCLEAAMRVEEGSWP